MSHTPRHMDTKLLGYRDGFPFDMLYPGAQPVYPIRDNRIMSQFSRSKITDSGFEGGQTQLDLAHVLDKSIDLCIQATQIYQQRIFGFFTH